MKNKKTIFIVLIAAIIILGVAGYLWHKSEQPQRAETTSRAATAQNNYTKGKPRPVVTDNSAGQGGAIDKAGQATATTTETPSSQWTVSASGAVTVEQPVADQVLKPGDTLRGTATVPAVQYRVVDNDYGLLGQGSLTVTDGKFSGVLQFQPRGTAGKVEVYTFDQQGREINSAQIPVTYTK